MKRLLTSLLLLFSFAASAQVVTPFVPQFKRKLPPDSIAIVGIGSTNLSFKLPDTSWVKKYTSTYFIHGFLNGTGTLPDPFGIANGYITPAMLHSISGVPGSGTVYYGDGHWGVISGGGDSTIYKADGSITDAIRNVNIGANQLNFIAKSGSDSTAVNISAAGGIFFDTYDITNHVEGIVSVFHGSPYLEASDSTSISDLFTSSSGNHSETTMQVVDKSTTNAKRIQMGTAHSGYIPGIVATDNIDNIGHIGAVIFPLYSGKQYAQYHGVDSIAKAKADSVKGTISSGGVTSIGVTTANGVSGSSSGGSTPNLTITLGAITPTSVNGVSSATMAFVDPTSSIQTQLNAKENLSNKATSFGTINNTLYPSVQAVNTQLGNYVPLVGGVTITGEVQSSYTPLAANDLARLTDLGLVPTVLSGMGVTVTGTTASIGSGTYRLNNITYTYPGGTVTISAQDGTQYRYSILYITTAGTISVTNGALVVSDPVIPDFPSNSVDVSTIYIPPTGNTITPTGGGNKATGTVTNVSSSNADILVANQKTTPVLTLNKVNGINLSFFNPTSAIQGQLNGKQAALSGTGFVKISGTTISYDNSTYLTGNQTISFAPTGDVTGSTTGSTTLAPVLTIGAGKVTNTMLAGSIDLTSKVSGVLPVANGGTGTSTPGIVAGTNITVTGTWPNQTVNSTGGGGGGTYVGDETPTGSINSSNTSFTVSHTPLTGSLSIYYNGQRLVSGTDYNLSGTTYTTTFAPLTGSTLKETYAY